MTCQDAIKLIHDYLDDEISPSDKLLLLKHTRECQECREHYHQLEKTVLLMQSHSHVMPPEDLTKKIMKQIPVEKPTGKLLRYIKGHPFLVAACRFSVINGGSLSQIWKDGQNQFSVTAPSMEQIVINTEQRLVIVPEDTVVAGNLIVRNGDIDVKGEVTGDVVVADGRIYMASTDQIVGQVAEIDQFFKWTWYHIQRWFKEALTLD